MTCNRSSLANENHQTELVAYPNPVNSLLNVEFNSTSESLTVLTLIDMLGKTSYRRSVNASEKLNKTSLNIETYTEGIYILSVNYQSMNRAIKITVSK